MVGHAPALPYLASLLGVGLGSLLEPGRCRLGEPPKPGVLDQGGIDQAGVRHPAMLGQLIDPRPPCRVTLDGEDGGRVGPPTPFARALRSLPLRPRHQCPSHAAAPSGISCGRTAYTSVYSQD